MVGGLNWPDLFAEMIQAWAEQSALPAKLEPLE